MMMMMMMIEGVRCRLSHEDNVCYARRVIK